MGINTYEKISMIEEKIVNTQKKPKLNAVKLHTHGEQEEGGRQSYDFTRQITSSKSFWLRLCNICRAAAGAVS